MLSGLGSDRGPSQGLKRVRAKEHKLELASGQSGSGGGVWVPSAGGCFGPDCLLQPRKPAGLVVFSFNSLINNVSQKFQICFLFYNVCI